MTNETSTSAPATTTRTRRNMDHSNCTHAATTDARTDCRESARKQGTWPLPAPTTHRPVGNVRIGAGKAVHATLTDGSIACGITRNDRPVHATTDDVTCGNCNKRNATN